ncbi:hypothetical protein IAU60_002569 [Kwoniella sp. DSM 27419]
MSPSSSTPAASLSTFTRPRSAPRPPSGGSSLKTSLGPTLNPPSEGPFASVGIKGSFANLVKLIGLDRIGGHASDDDDHDLTADDAEDDLDEAGEGDVDEDSLMWDAQTALIAHHTDLAVKLYTQAALPPFCSPAACLALGNLLIRGSTLAEHSDSSPGASPRSSRSSSLNAESSRPPPSFLTRLFGTGSPPRPPATAPSRRTSSPPARPEASRRTTADLVASGWQIPREGKRAVRDVKGMGVAAAWFVLGLGWLVQAQVELEKEVERTMLSRDVTRFLASIPDAHVRTESTTDPDEEPLTFDLKAKGKGPRRQVQVVVSSLRDTIPDVPAPPKTAHELAVDDTDTSSDISDSTATIRPPNSGPGSSEGTTESPMVQTPGTGIIHAYNGQRTEKNLEGLQMMYDLLVPLLHLYRHGHIQSQDPLALPPIAMSALPASLRPRNESDKRRNVWHLGGILAARLAKLGLLSEDRDHTADLSKLRGGVNILTNYILAMTSRDVQAEGYFRNVVAASPTGSELADDLIRHAAKRLDILSSTPKDEKRHEGFPFPAQAPDRYLSPPKTSRDKSPQSKRQSPSAKHRRLSSTSSVKSNLSTLSFSDILCAPIKGAPSVASLTLTSDAVAEAISLKFSEEEDGALSTLRRIHAKSMSDLSAAIREDEEGEEEDATPSYPSLNGWKMSPPETSLSIPTDSPFGTSHASQRTIIPDRARTGDSFNDPAGSFGSRRFDEAGAPPVGSLRPIASSPQFGTLRRASKLSDTGTTASTPRRRLPFEPTGEIATIDPALAAAELSSALTKHVTCGVCGGQGVNFPECRKCGLTFCSRDCRVGEDKAGNGKKHICGAWQSRQLLDQPPRLVRAIPSIQPARVY